MHSRQDLHDTLTECLSQSGLVRFYHNTNGLKIIELGDKINNFVHIFLVLVDSSGIADPWCVNEPNSFPTPLVEHHVRLAVLRSRLSFFEALVAVGVVTKFDLNSPTSVDRSFILKSAAMWWKFHWKRDYQ